VHRDIKPENLMVRRDGYVKILDFGLARQTPLDGENSADPSALLGGTLNYMSPEQTRGERASDASDIFSLGVVLSELATGRHPFLADSPIDTAHEIAHGSVRPNSELLPLALSSVISAMLAKDPQQRPSASEVEQRLAISAAQKPLRKRRAMAWLIASGIAAVVAFSALAFRPPRDRVPASQKAALREITRQAPENRVTAAAISPDGITLAFSALGERVQLRRLSDNFSRSLATPKSLQVNQIAWFADGSKLLVSGVDPKGESHTIWTTPVLTGDPERLTLSGSNAVPSPDGKRIAFTSPDGGNIWIADVNGRNARQIRGGVSSTGLFSAISWSPDGKRISYQRREYAPPEDRQVQGPASQVELNHAYSFETSQADTGRIVASVKNISMVSACTLPDGRVLYLSHYSFARMEEQNLWELPTDPNTGRILGSARLLYSGEGLYLSSISATNDGKQVAAVRRSEHPNIYTAQLPRTDPPKLIDMRRLTFTLGADYPHAWTPDSRAIIFESNRNGTVLSATGSYDLFRQNIESREAEPLAVSTLDEVMAQVSPDGKWIVYREDVTQPGNRLKRLPIGGGSAVEVPTALKATEFRCGLRAGSRCVLRTVENNQFIFFELDPVHGQGRELARTVWSPTITGDWDLSPDGRVVAIPNHDPQSAKIRIVVLSGSATNLGETTYTLQGLKNIHGLTWSANGRGWYVCSRGSAGWILSYSDMQGRSWELLRPPSPTFAVPSPDGRRLALPLHTVSSNVWVLEGFPKRDR
jgi:serine/threonine protein kinase